MEKERRIVIEILDEFEELLGRKVIRASFSQKRMSYVRDESKLIYQSKDGKNEKVFDALEWLAAMCSHVPYIRRTDGQILRPLQQCKSRETKKTRPG